MDKSVTYVRRTRKLHLIEEILKIENEAVLEEVKTVIIRSKLHAISRRNFNDFAGMLSDEEADELEINASWIPVL